MFEALYWGSAVGYEGGADAGKKEHMVKIKVVEESKISLSLKKYRIITNAT